MQFCSIIYVFNYIIIKLEFASGKLKIEYLDNYASPVIIVWNKANFKQDQLEDDENEFRYAFISPERKIEATVKIKP